MKKILIASIALLLVGCSQQTQAETTPPTTIAIETTVAETTTAIETTKATQSFTEEQSILFDAVRRVWGIKSDEEKVALGRGGLIELIKESFLDYTDSEYEKMADHILSQYPILEIKETVEDTKADNTKADNKSDNKSNTSGSTKAETNTSNTTQPTEPTPQPQPTQAPQTPEPVYTEPEISAEEQAEWEAFQAEMAERARKQAEVGTIDNSDLGPDSYGYDGSGDINLGGGM